MAKRLNIVEENFLKTIKENNLINEGDKIVIGVSGGSDSITLLYLLNKYKEKFKIKLYVCHINHMIREDSTIDEQYVENMCKKMNVPFYKKRVQVEQIAKKNKMGTEEAGRIIRYEFFREIAKKENANKIAIAHNMNDNAETMLLNLIRGSGLSGLEGITPKENNIIRPLINSKKTDINNFCKENNIEYKIDSTNKQNIYRRNIIRNEVIPKLEEINPNIVETLSRTSKIIKQNNTFIKETTKSEYKKITHIISDEEKTTNTEYKKNAHIISYEGKLTNKAINKEDQENEKTLKENKHIEINLKEFNLLSENIKQNVILKAIEDIQGNTKNIEKANIDEVIQIAKRNVGRKYTIINKNVKAEIKKGKLEIY